MSSTSRQPAVNNLVWEPVVAAECVVVPNEIMRITRHFSHYSYKDFCGPFQVSANEELLFNIHFNIVGCQVIEGVLHQPSAAGKSRELLVTSRVSWTQPHDRPDNNYVTLFVPDKTEFDTSDTLKIMRAVSEDSTALHFTLKLTVYAARRATAEASISYCLNFARQSGSPFCDVLLRVDDQDFPAHKAVLSATSSVFSAMFCGEFKEKFTGTVLIEGVSKVAFGKFLDFLYTEDVTTWEGSELELLDLSERYHVARLKARCELCLWGLGGPRALSILMEADKWAVVTDALKERLYTVVIANWQCVVHSDEWKALQASNPVLAGLVKAAASGAAVAFTVKVIHKLPPLA